MSLAPDSNSHNGKGKPGETNSGRNFFEWTLRAAALLVAVTNTNAAWKIAQDQKEIADSYQRAAQQLRDYYKQTYLPFENEEIKEAMAMKPYVKAYDTSAGRMSAGVLSALQDMYRDAVVCAPRYCTGNAASMLMDLKHDTDKALLAARIQGVRMEDAKYEALEERRHSFINKALNRGRDILSSSDSFSEVSVGIYGRLGANAAKGAGGAMKFLGYSFARSQRENPLGFVSRAQYDPRTEAPPTVTPAPTSSARRPEILG